MREKDYSISLLRMLAVISIIFCHSFEYSSSIFVDKGWILESIGNYLANGVQVFLIISGFLYGTESKKNLFSDSKTRVKFLILNYLIATFLSIFSGIILYHSCRKIEKLISLKKESK